MTKLQVLSLDSLEMSTVVPDSLKYLSSSLTSLSLSDCLLQGNFPINIFHLPNLQMIRLSQNPSLAGKFLANNWTSPIEYLDVSETSFSELPDSIGNLKLLGRLMLGYSQFVGLVPASLGNLTQLTLLHLMHNNFSGHIPSSLSNLVQLTCLDLSSNSFVGEIPDIVNLTQVSFFDLSNNQLAGPIPSHGSRLSVMDLRNNRLNGSIPGTFAESNWLRSLNLNNNELGGGIPQSLVNCTKLEVLDIGNNKINDAFPYWLGNLPELQVLVLRSNKFHGSVREFEPKESFPKLRILDLSINNFSGYLPERFLENLNAMRNVGADEGKLQYLGEEYYQDSVVVTLKGTKIELQKILTVFTTIDFSSNGFDGEISQVIGKLHSLRLLNLSHNHFTGQIPSSLGNLAKLESLDLSSNNPARKIPKPLTSLTSLSVLNLSHNQLDGLIPHRPQFNTFQEDSYIGNLGLCGFPLTKKCSNDEAPTTFHEEDEEAESSSSWFDWKFAKIGYGSGLVIGMSIGYMVFSSGEPLWFMKMVVTWQSKKVRTRGIRRGRLIRN